MIANESIDVDSIIPATSNMSKAPYMRHRTSVLIRSRTRNADRFSGGKMLRWFSPIRTSQTNWISCEVVALLSDIYETYRPTPQPILRI